MSLKNFQNLQIKNLKVLEHLVFLFLTTTSWAIDILESHGYVYDTSIVPAKTRLYGVENAQHTPYFISSKSLEKNDYFREIIRISFTDN